MEKHPHPFDDFLKEALKGHQLVPPEKAKKAFLKEASSIIPTRKGWNYWYFLPILAVFISVIVAVLYYPNRNESAPSALVITEKMSSKSIKDSANSPSTSTPASTLASKPENKSNTTVSSLPVEKNTTTKSESSSGAGDLPVYSNMNPLEPKASIIDTSKSTVPSIPSFNGNPSVNDTLLSKTTTSKVTLDTLSKNGIGFADALVQPVPLATDTTTPETGPENAGIPRLTRANQTPYFTAGVFYLPEWMFNTLEDSKFVNNFGFEATYYRGQFSIRSGAGISISKGIVKNSIQYNEYLGAYNKLDSITFTFNEADHDFIPDLHMSSEKVWDSIAKLDSADMIKRYTYLQIPLILGFDFWQRGILTIGVRVGTIMSVLLDAKQLTDDYNPGENKVVGINMITPEQVSVNWQAIGGINASVRLTKDFFLEIEPQAKYYYQSIYEKSDMTEKPWSVGLRAAVTYRF